MSEARAAGAGRLVEAVGGIDGVGVGSAGERISVVVARLADGLRSGTVAIYVTKRTFDCNKT
jgi:hypothetical protein